MKIFINLKIFNQLVNSGIIWNKLVPFRWISLQLQWYKIDTYSVRMSYVEDDLYFFVLTMWVIKHLSECCSLWMDVRVKILIVDFYTRVEIVEIFGIVSIESWFILNKISEVSYTINRFWSDWLVALTEYIDQYFDELFECPLSLAS